MDLFLFGLLINVKCVDGAMLFGDGLLVMLLSSSAPSLQNCPTCYGVKSGLVAL